MSRFAARPLDDPIMWCRLIGRMHPDAGGGHEKFVWAQALREAVARHAPLPPPAPSPARASRDRVRYTGRFPGFTAHTVIILTFAPQAPPWAVRLLDLLADCGERGTADERAGATFKQLAALAHRAGLTYAQRQEWYRVAEDLELTQRHVGHMLGRLAHAP